MKTKKNQLIVSFEKIETLMIIEHGGKNDEINKILAELRQEIDFVLRQNKHKTIEVNIHRGLEIITKLIEFL
jgi:cupin superfamily acireductone dioxygenase involved in methionine salvage